MQVEPKIHSNESMTFLKALGTIIFIFLISNAFAQTYIVSGKVQSKSDKQSLIGSTAKATLISDSTIWFGSVTDLDGNFSIQIQRKGDYEIKIQYIGYQPTIINLNVPDLNSSSNLGIIDLKPSEQLLKEVEITDRADRVTVKGDTSEFNAGAYKVNRNADAKSILEKMPGITNQNGVVSAQGEKVQKILVDGKEFFGNDPNVALNTIPAEIIDKIQVFDQQSEQSQQTGFNDGNTVKTLNIITKQGKSEGEFGKVFAGVGTDNRYLAGGNVNLFKGSRRISILGLSNNVNQVNFSSEDIAGAVGSDGSERRHGPRRQGVGTGSSDDFMVSTPNGINNTSALGLNFSDEFGKKLKINGSYLYNNTENKNDYSLTRNFISGLNQNQVYDESANQRSTNINHRLNLRAEYNFNKQNTLLLKPSFSYQNYNQSSAMDYQTFLADTLLSRGLNTSFGNTKANNFNNEMLFTHRFSKQGQSVSLSVRSSYNQSKSDDGLKSIIVQSDDSQLTTDNWEADRNEDTHSEKINLSFTQPLGKNMSLEIGYRPEWTMGTTDWLTKNANTDGEYTIRDSALSNNLDSRFFTQEGRLRLRIRGKEKSMFLAGLGYQYTENENQEFFPQNYTTTRTYSNVIPFALYRKTFENKSNIFMLYRGRPDLPSVQQLNTVIDNSNPLQVSYGNQDLDQSYSHRFITRYTTTNAEKGTNFFIFASAQAEDNKISNSTHIVSSDTTFSNGFVLPAGGQITQPVNLDGYYNLNSFSNYGFPVDVLKSNLNLNANLGYTRSPGLVNDVLNYSETTKSGIGFILGSNISEKVDFKIGASADFFWVQNSLTGQTNSDYQNYKITASTVLSPIDRWVLSSDLTYNIYQGLGSSLDKPFTLWNASVGYRFLKDESLQASLGIFDILSQNNSISRSITETYIEDSQTDVLQQYVMFSLSYRIRNFKGSEKEK